LPFHFPIHLPIQIIALRFAPTARLVKQVMEDACGPRCELSVPLVVETGWAASWDQAH